MAASSGLAGLGANMANQNAMSMNNATQQRISGYQNSANANGQAFAGVAGAFNNWYQDRSANNGGSAWANTKFDKGGI